MKRSFFAVLLLGTILSTTNANPNPQQFSVGMSASFGDAGYFHTSLSPYGEWLELESGFYAWRPHRTHSGWRPYLHGHWSWTRFGWYWVSSEPFGWAVFHYGRWFYDDYYGWIWIPDRTWGPAWVEWRYDNDYVGWAPLPPYASFSINFGIRFTMHWTAPHRYWNFVRYRHMTSPYLYREVAPMKYARRLIGTTRSAGRYEFDGDRVINRGVDRSIVERRGGYRRIDAVDVQETSTPRERQIRDNNRYRIETYRPDARGHEQAPVRIEARRPERGTSLDLQHIERTQRDATRAPTTPTARETERERGAVNDNTRPVDRTPQDETIKQGERRVEQPQQPPIEHRQIERRRTESDPRIREQAEPKREKTITAPERSQRQERREVTAPRTRTEQARPAPSTRQESSRRTEQAGREGERKRN